MKNSTYSGAVASRYLLHMIMVAALAAISFMTKAQTLTSDKDDYYPGEIATLTGSGFAPGETVVLQVLHYDGTPASGEDHDHWEVIADREGNFVTTWHVCEDDCAGSTLRATANGLSSGYYADAVFTDANLTVLGSDNNAHGTVGGEENLGTLVPQGTPISISCPRGTGLTLQAAGASSGPNNVFPVSWTLAYGGAGTDNSILSPLTTITPNSGSITSGGSTGAQCVAMTIATGSLTVGTTYHGSLIMTATDAKNV